MSLALLKHLAPSMGAYESSDQASNDDFNKRPAKKQAREARFKTHAERMTAMREAQKAQGRRKYRKRSKPIKIDNTNGAIVTVPRRKILKLRTPAVRELRRNVTPSTLSARKTLATTHTVEKKVREQKRRRDQRKQEKYERATQPAIFHETIGCFNCGDRFQFAPQVSIWGLLLTEFDPQTRNPNARVEKQQGPCDSACATRGS